MEQKENEVIAFIKKRLYCVLPYCWQCFPHFYKTIYVNYITYLDYRVLVLLFCLLY